MNFLRRLLGNRPATAAPEPSVAESAAHGAVETPVEKAPPKEPASGKNHPEIADARLKLESARCDLHPLYPLLSATIEVQLPSDPVAPLGVAQSKAHSPRMKVLRCTKAQCDRHYTSEFGYFCFTAGHPSQISEIKTTPDCRVNHDTRYLLVTKIGGHFLWACPEEGCTNANPYVEALPKNEEAAS